MDSQDGELFVKHLAAFVRTHEKALADAINGQQRRPARHGPSQSTSSLAALQAGSVPPQSSRPSTAITRPSGLVSSFSMTSLNLLSPATQAARLGLTPHHLFYLLSRFEELGISVGPMGIRLESLQEPTSSANYVSFLSQSQRTKSQASDVGSIRSVSSVRSVMSGMSALWSAFGIGSSVSVARQERHKASLESDLKQLYSAFTKIPCLRLSPDWRAKLIAGYEEFPFDSAVPLHVFKNLQSLEICDLDFRQFCGWDRMADQLKSLTLRRACIEDSAEILIDIILDDIDKRRRRTSKAHAQHMSNSPVLPTHGSSSPRRSVAFAPSLRINTLPSIPMDAASPTSPRFATRGEPFGSSAETSSSRDQRLVFVKSRNDMPPPVPPKSSRNRSQSPRRPQLTRDRSSHTKSSKIKRSGSGSSHSDQSDMWPSRRGSVASMPCANVPKWRFLRHLGLMDNSLTALSAVGLAPLANTLQSLDLSSNLFTQIPESLATLTSLRALNLSNCMIDSLRSLTRNPLPAVTALNLRGNRLSTLVGIERLPPLERLDLRDNRMNDPTELARLTSMPEIRELWIEGNPFTKTHRDYRVTIFNLFRKTPGYTSDIIIDATGPNYAERKMLVERAQEPPSVPVVRPIIKEMPSVAVQKPAIVHEVKSEITSDLLAERRQSVAVASELDNDASRRHRAPKRRIIDLAETSPRKPSVTADERAEGRYRLSQPPEIHQTTARPPSPAATRPSTIRLITEPTSATPRIDPSSIPQLRSGPTSPGSQRSAVSQKPVVPVWDAASNSFLPKSDTLRDSASNSYFGLDGAEASYYSITSPLSANTSPPHTTPIPVIRSGRSIG